jgi:hypothetical protein
MKIKRLYFKFLWAKTWNKKPIESISRSALKMSREQGGISALDIECLHEAIKIKQVVNACTKDNIMKDLQLFLLKE